ncbi:hypothetical protein DRF75_00675 [Ehrlichia minasensis]|uniref:Uncharacterized protein n=1 Tax=Ehrlichia minasensis TaxID=1242993 RepID=A0A4Q6ICX2_9RICK|nr:hypothetical protein [Ehrlichia minasensis]RZB13208.1 hypothetical protein DRF75_00675 [Ehrlichia minasensis]CEI85342.1 Uncharacterized protein ehr_00736 [Ehrlichia minasensis]
MDLTLLLLNNGKPFLIPTNKCHIKKNADGQVQSCTTDDPSLNSNLGAPDPQSPYADYHTLYLSRFTKYALITSVRFPVDMVFLFGKSEVSDQVTFLFIKIPKESVRTLSEHGTLLDGSFLVGGGIANQNFNDIPYQRHVKDLFQVLKNRIRVNFSTQVCNNYVLSFFDAEGNLFDTEYVNTKLEDTILEPSTGDTLYIKTLQ